MAASGKWVKYLRSCCHEGLISREWLSSIAPIARWVSTSHRLGDRIVFNVQNRSSSFPREPIRDDGIVVCDECGAFPQVPQWTP